MNITEDTQEQHTTFRAVSEGAELYLNKSIKVLEGHVRMVDYMGNDDAIVQAARVSYGKGTKKVSQDRALIFYLMRNWHTTPFEMCEVKLHVKLPIFVARQWIRHRTASVNEHSARYSRISDEFYVPDLEAISAQSKTNKQGRHGVIDQAEAEQFRQYVSDSSTQDYEHYLKILNEDSEGNVIDDERQGVARELARIHMGVNYYTEWYWKIDLHNLFHFLMLRMDPHAQYEIRLYATAISEIVKHWVPISYSAFEEYRLRGARLSATALTVIKKMMTGEQVTQESSNLSKREWHELMQILQ